MIYQIGQKVITPDDEQGFVSDVYEDGIFDVDILDDNGVDTNSIEYNLEDGVHIAVDQRPQLEDITPLGRVMGTHIMREGIINVHTCNSLAYAGLWLSRDRVAYLNGYGEITLNTPKGEVKSLGEFRDVCNELGVIDATLNSEYSLKGF